MGATQAQVQVWPPPLRQPILRQSGEALATALAIGSKGTFLKASSYLATRTKI